jgi:hypothetical protein
MSRHNYRCIDIKEILSTFHKFSPNNLTSSFEEFSSITTNRDRLILGLGTKENGCGNTQNGNGNKTR